MAIQDTRKDKTMADDGPKLDRWEEEQLAAIARDAVDVVRNKMLHQHAAEAERDKERARAEAAEKRAQEAERRAGVAEKTVGNIRTALGMQLLHVDAEAVEMIDALKARFDGAERIASQWRKVAEGLVRELDQAREANARLVNRIHDIRQLVGGEEDLVEGIRALKARCEGAERAASTMDGSAYVHGVERERSDWRERAMAAEAVLAERNPDVDRLKREDASLRDRIQEYEVAFAAINRALDGCDTRLDADKVVAKIRALKDQRDDSEADCMTAQGEQESLEGEVVSLRAQVAELNETIKATAHGPLAALFEIGRLLDSVGQPYAVTIEKIRGLQAQVDSIAGAMATLLGVTMRLAPYPPEVAEGVIAACDVAREALPEKWRPKRPGDERILELGDALRLQDRLCRMRTVGMRELIESLPPISSPKTGRWKCGRCTDELCVRSQDLVGEERQPKPKWTWDAEHTCWLHWCYGWGGFPAHRIGDAPEVTP